jgi:uncharacterized phage protein (TIGR02220 family)
VVIINGINVDNKEVSVNNNKDIDNNNPIKEKRVEESKVEENEIIGEQLQEVIDYFNEQCGRNFQLTPKIIPMMKKILKQYGIEKMKRACYLQVLDCKDDPETDRYMTPTTLFRNFENFDRALNKSEEAIKMKKFKTNPKRNVYIEPNKKEMY